MFLQADKIILGFIYINGIEEVIDGIWVYFVVLGYFLAPDHLDDVRIDKFNRAT